MQITVLGSGTSQGIPVIGCKCDTCISADTKDKRLRSSVLIEINDKYIAIDVGPDFRQQMLAHNVPRMDAVLITHEHNDHVAGLDDIRPFNFLQGGKMPLYAQQRVIDDIQRKFAYIFDIYPYPGSPRIICHTIEANTMYDIFQDVGLQTLRISHGNLPILGYRIAGFAYITDASSIDIATMALLKDLDVLILNALQFRHHHSHYNFDEAVAVAQQINATNTYLTHLSHTLGTHTQLSELCPPNIQPAWDGMTLLL